MVSFQNLLHEEEFSLRKREEPGRLNFSRVKVLTTCTSEAT